MTVSKAFWKIVLKNIGTIITYTSILVSFGTINVSSGSMTTQFEAVKPKIAVFNHDEETGMTKNLLEYLDKNAEVQQDYAEESVKDDLFYESIVMAIDIPEGYNADFLAGKKNRVIFVTWDGCPHRPAFLAELDKAFGKSGTFRNHYDIAVINADQNLFVNNCKQDCPKKWLSEHCRDGICIINPHTREAVVDSSRDAKQVLPLLMAYSTWTQPLFKK